MDHEEVHKAGWKVMGLTYVPTPTRKRTHVRAKCLSCGTVVHERKDHFLNRRKCPGPKCNAAPVRNAPLDKDDSVSL